MSEKDSLLKRPIVPIETWLESEYYLGPEAKAIRPYWKEKIKEFYNDPVKKSFLFTGSMRSGKTYVAIILIIRFIYEISCYKNYPSIFGLSPTTLPKVMFFSYSKGKADSTGISRILRILEKIPYFSNPETTYNRDLHSKVSFPYVEIISGVSEAHAIGEDMLGAVLDESNVRHTAKANILEDAQKLYTEIQARSQMTYSKNGVWGGFTGIISSTKYTSSFTQVKIDQARDGNDESLFIVEAALYDANPTGFSKERFDVYVGGSSEIPSFIVEDADDDIKNQVNSATGLSFEAFLKQNEEWVIHVPRSVKNIYKNDIDYALMNISGIARSARSNFIKNRKLIDQLFKKDVKSPLIFENPLIGIRDTMDPDDYIDWSVIDEHYQGQPVYIHADLSKSNDRSGFSALYYDRDANKIRPIVVCALYHDRSIPDNPIDTTKAFELVKAMTNHGIYVRVVSADMASSDYFLQQAKLLYGKDPVTGVERSQYQSVDRTSNAYFTMLMFMRKDMIDLYEYPQLRKELSELIYDREADKVDHPSNPDSQNPIHWKDISDSLAGACYHISLMEKLDMSSQELVQSPLVNSQEKSDDFYGSDLFKSDGFYDNLADGDESIANSKSSPLDLNTFEQQYYGGRYV